MRQHLGFLKASRIVVKVAAWIIVLAFYIFMFFFFFLIAKIADLLIKIVNEITKE
jgi:hypothetical protein